MRHTPHVPVVALASRPLARTLCCAALAFCCTTSIAAAQALDLPAASLKAKVEQRVGITDVTLDYSSPAVRGRKIWGTLVAYDKVWRAGANAPTKLTVSRDFSFGGTKVPAGSYTVFMVPGKASWAVALNSDLAAGENTYDAKKDVARVTTKPVALPALRERLRYTLDDPQDDKVTIALEWERVRIAVPLTIDTATLVNASIEKLTTDAWQAPFTAASYLHRVGQTDRALAQVDRSIAIKSNWRNEWLRAQIQQKKGNKAEAVAAANRAQELGKGDKVYEDNVKADLVKTVASWK
jgi:hypothetical protein